MELPKTIKLSKPERLILSNQYKILEKLYPNEVKELSQYRKIVEDGYSYEYDEISKHIYDEMNERECEEVLDILGMHRALYFSAQELKQKPKMKIIFPGFDGNNETKQMAYTRFYLDDLQRFDELKNISQFPDYNSHCLTLARYKLMLAEWNKCKDKNNLTKEEIDRILDVHIK